MNKTHHRPEFGFLPDMAIVAGWGRNREELAINRLRLVGLTYSDDPETARKAKNDLADLRHAIGFGVALAACEWPQPAYGAPRLTEDDLYPVPEGFRPLADDYEDSEDLECSFL